MTKLTTRFRSYTAHEMANLPTGGICDRMEIAHDHSAIPITVAKGEAPRIVEQMSPENVAWVDGRDRTIAVLERVSACSCMCAPGCLHCAARELLAAAVGPELDAEPVEAVEGVPEEGEADDG